ncbi:MAG: hypothetical protein JWQ01_4912 [Massilia sp.]|nr:hypothetical protein [Massilia sp.]
MIRDILHDIRRLDAREEIAAVVCIAIFVGCWLLIGVGIR